MKLLDCEMVYNEFLLLSLSLSQRGSRPTSQRRPQKPETLRTLNIRRLECAKFTASDYFQTTCSKCFKGNYTLIELT